MTPAPRLLTITALTLISWAIAVLAIRGLIAVLEG